MVGGLTSRKGAKDAKKRKKESIFYGLTVLAR